MYRSLHISIQAYVQNHRKITIYNFIINIPDLSSAIFDYWYCTPYSKVEKRSLTYVVHLMGLLLFFTSFSPRICYIMTELGISEDVISYPTLSTSEAEISYLAQGTSEDVMSYLAHGTSEDII